MVATFAANLAAFLTVERMETQVAGLEELAQQSKINYTVVEGSSYYEYFQNMASAEKNLYEKWKDMTLSRLVNPTQYPEDDLNKIAKTFNKTYAGLKSTLQRFRICFFLKS